MMLVLGIESTCDETGCSVVRDGREILSNVIASQIDLHTVYGGVVPELACRRHIDVLIPVLDQALREAQVSLEEIDLVAVAYGPGLIGALWIGLEAAKALSFVRNIPLIGINHIEAHLYAAWMAAEEPPPLPAIGAVLSGGHTSLVLMEDVGSYRLIGQTVDDAVGEAFDKAAKLLHLPYPGGPFIEKHARSGNPKAFPFKAGQVKGKPFHFSFSGLKTALLYAIQKCSAPVPVDDLAASFQEAAFRDILSKIKLAAHEHRTKTVLIGGGVAQNQQLRKLLAQEAPDLQIFWAPPVLCGDNAAMIAGLAFPQYLKRGADSFALAPSTRIPFRV